ncbi:carnitine transporter [Dimargaris cristalligena]|uniref:Putative mitochondrial carnitine/acylcarnitine carrier protein n=1 Tax=Dimargaris cristalligena TaxID=215637 RepID=A0A4P9ZZQ3_9FUNG|nr:carnitine transporter [Dimargaris cristalligena]RKP38611.1 putative mitochondrial carnitine/acylcarnitine carrier protein [Dimargaris cristalligena]|eukprot:RKP38611.1 putative mitochondrial carnitine/acylcarnitine carrier protein [Dimargaris cristalligena]
MSSSPEPTAVAAPAPPPTSAVKSFLSGGFGGICLVAAGHPLDLIKVRLQTSTQYKGTLDVFRQTLAKDGIRGLYRGMATPLVGVTPIFATCFWGYDMGKRIARWSSQTDASTPLTMGQILFAGGFSAIPATLLMTPTERIKCLLQIQGHSNAPPKYNGPIHAARVILKESGIRGLFKGTGATLLRDIPGSVAYFGAYELFKQMFTPEGAEPGQLSTVAVLMAGGLAGMANWAVAIPPDVLKSRLQTAPEGTYRGIRDVFVHLMKTEGPKALFRGLGPAMLRAFPANAACFLGVEVSLQAMNKLW